MTFIISNKGIENTEGTEVTMSGKVTNSGSFDNSGKVNIEGSLESRGNINVKDSGALNVTKDTLNIGDINIGGKDLKDVIIQVAKSTGTVAEFGTELLKKIGLPTALFK